MKAKLKFTTGKYEAFKLSVLSNARALDRGEGLPDATTITFESMEDMLHVLTPNRLRLLEVLAANGGLALDVLAKGLRRSPAAVRRDLTILRNLGVVETSPDEGRATIARPFSRNFEFVYTFRAKLWRRHSHHGASRLDARAS